MIIGYKIGIVVDKTGASNRSSFADELIVRRAKLEKLNMLWEDRVIATLERCRRREV